MKVFIVFFICIAAVFGYGRVMPENEKKIHAMMKEASKTCIRQMQLDPSLVNENGPTLNDPLNEDCYYLACVDKKIGVMTKDASYSLEQMLSFEDTPERKQRAENAYNNIVKDCPPEEIKGDFCRMAACAQETLKQLAAKNEW